MAENVNDNIDNPDIQTVDALDVGTMTVQELKTNVYLDLADLTSTLEKQGEKQLRALMRQSNIQNARTMQKGTVQNSVSSGINSGQKEQKQSQKQQSRNTNTGTPDTSINQSVINTAESGIETARKGISGLQQVKASRQIIAEETPKQAKKEPKNTTPKPTGSVPVTGKNKPYDPKTARRNRTIEIDAPAAEVVPARAAAPAKPETPPAQDSKNNGYYVDANGRLRRPDGKFASKVELRRYHNEQNQDVDEKTAAKRANANGAQMGFLAKAIGRLTGKAAETDATNAAGVAAGGSYWLAAKEVAEMASNFKESLRLRKLTSVKGVKEYASNKARGVKRVVTAPVRAGKALFNRVTGRKQETTATPPAAPAKTPAAPVSGSKTAFEQGVKTKADDARAEKQINVIEANHEQTQQVLEEILDELKPKQKGLVDSLLGGGKQLWDMTRGRRGQRGTVGGRRGSTRKVSRKATTKRGRVGRAAGGLLDTAEEVLDDLDNSQGIDINNNGTGKDKTKTTGKEKTGKTAKAERSTVAKTKAERKAMARGRKTPTLGRNSKGLVRKTGLLSRVTGAIPKAISEIPSVASAASVGKNAAKMTGKGLLSVGKGAAELTGKGVLAGARALPLVGQALALGMAGYDAYNGYNDTEAQKGIFNLKDGQQATTGQKSSTAAANVLDMGGLTSGISGLAGDLAGWAGMKNTQDALTFDSGDIAKAMYDSMSGGSARKAMGLKDGENMTIGQKLASGTASVIDMGGLTSFLAKTVGSVAEDAGIKGAKNAMNFDAGTLAKTIYAPFSDKGALGSLAKSVGDFNSDSIVDAIKDLISVVKVGGDNGDTTINNTSYSTPSNWSGQYSGKMPNGVQIPLALSQMGKEAALPDGYLNAVAGVESGGNPLAHNKSGATGLFQFMPSTASAMGGFNPFDPEASTKAMVDFTRQNAAYFQKNMGRDATGRELYLMHQQGMAGGTKLLKNPDALASSVVGKQAVLQNGGNANMTARQFAELQMGKYDRQFAANQTAAPLKVGADSKGVKGIPPMLAAPEPQAKPATQVTASTVPLLLQRPPATPVDIQKRNEAKDKAEAQKEQPPLVAKLDPAMGKSLSNIESLLKQQNKGQGGSTTSTKETGRNPTVSGHDYVSGHMSDLARDRG